MRILQSLIRKDDGNVIIMVGVFILLIFAIGGAGVDFGRAQLVQMKEQQAADAAALAAATILDKNTHNAKEEQIRIAAAYRYYKLNFPPTYLGIDRNTPNYSFNKGTGNIVVANSQSLITNYITTMGRTNIDVGASTRVNIPSKNLPDFDVVMVVDESGSTEEMMTDGSGKTRFQAEKEAVYSMVDNLFPDNQPENPNLRMGLIGHSGPIDHAHGLSSNKAEVQTYVDAIDVYGETYSHWGLEAGFNMITGVWNGFYPPTKLCGIDGKPKYCLAERNTGVPGPVTDRDDGEQLSKVKYLVFITDGEIMHQALPCWGGIEWYNMYPALYTDDPMQYGAPVPAAPPPGVCNNYPEFLEQCTKLKNAGVTVFTINFAQQDTNDIDPMTQCASTPDKYYYAPDGDTLKGILTGIAKKANKVRITD